MSIGNTIACCLLALVVGGCVGFLARMHTLQDTVLAAMAYRAEAAENYYAIQTSQMLAQLDKEERTKRPGPGTGDRKNQKKGEK